MFRSTVVTCAHRLLSAQTEALLVSAVVPNQTVRHLLPRESTYRGTSEVLDAKQIPDEYEMGKKLGEGQFASVYLVKVRRLGWSICSSASLRHSLSLVYLLL